jgi:hypothetical protein
VPRGVSSVRADRAEPSRNAFERNANAKAAPLGAAPCGPRGAVAHGQCGRQFAWNNTAVNVHLAVVGISIRMLGPMRGANAITPR